MSTVNNWVQCPDLPYPVGSAAPVVHGNKIYIIGGAYNGNPSTFSGRVQTCIYDVSTEEWTLGPDLPENRYAAGSTYYDGKIYIVQGYKRSGSSGFQRYQQLLVWDLETDTFTTSATSITDNHQSHCFHAIGDTLYLSTTRGIWKYHPQTGVWDAPNPVQTMSIWPFSAVWGSKIYCSDNRTMRVYDTLSDTWLTAENATVPIVTAPQPVTAYSIPVAVEGVLYFVPRNITTNSPIYAYHPDTKEWTTHGKYPHVTKDYHCTVYCQGKIYVIGGCGSSGYLNAVYAFTPEESLLKKSYTVEEKYLSTSNLAEILPASTEQLEEGQSYEKAAPSVEGYQYLGYQVDDGDLVEAEVAVITDIQADHTVRYLYEIITEPEPGNVAVTAEYRNGHGAEIYPAHEQSVPIGTDLEVSAVQIDGYRYIGYLYENEEPLPESTLTLYNLQEGCTIVFLYEQEPEEEYVTVTGRYQTVSGTQLIGDTRHSVPVGSNFIIAAAELEEYDYVGYRLDEGELMAGHTIELTDIAQDHAITFLYQKREKPGAGNCCSAKVTLKVESCCCNTAILGKMQELVRECACSCEGKQD